MEMEMLEQLMKENQDVLIRLKNEEEHEANAWYRKGSKRFL